jgi:mannan endo-1,4-beta-mannosidase
LKSTVVKFALFLGSVSSIVALSSCRLVSRLYNLQRVGLETSSDFVRVEAGQLKLQGKPFVFAGSNFYRLALSDAFGAKVEKEYRSGKAFFPQIDKVMEQYSAEGIKVIRLWGFSCEGSRGSQANPALLRKDFSFDEEAWKQLDFTLATARRYGIKVILPLVNFEHEYCGMEWWVEQTALSLANGAQQGFSWSCYDQNSHTLYKLAWNREECRGQGEPVYTKELFFTHEKVWERYETYVKSVLTRINPYTGVAYKDDTAIFGIELANEPHTSNYYECMITKVGELDKDNCAGMNPSVYASTYSVG